MYQSMYTLCILSNPCNTSCTCVYIIDVHMLRGIKEWVNEDAYNRSIWKFNLTEKKCASGRGIAANKHLAGIQSSITEMRAV